MSWWIFFVTFPRKTFVYTAIDRAAILYKYTNWCVRQSHEMMMINIITMYQSHYHEAFGKVHLRHTHLRTDAHASLFSCFEFEARENTCFGWCREKEIAYSPHVHLISLEILSTLSEARRAMGEKGIYAFAPPYPSEAS